MLREVARRVATAVVLLCAAALAFSIVVALAYKGQMGAFGELLTGPDFGLWVAGFEAVLALGGLGLIVLLFVPIDDSEENLEAAIGDELVEPVRLSDCPTCGADLADIEFDMDTLLECPNCGEDLLDEIKAAQASADGSGDASVPSGAAAPSG